MKRVLFFLLTLALVAGGCRPEAHGPKLIPLKVEFLPIVTFAPLAIAKEKGYFRDEGIDAQLLTIHSDAAAPAVITGQLDVFASTVNIAVLNAMARGGRIVFVADKSYFPPTGCVSESVLIRTGINPADLTKPEFLKTLRVSWANNTSQQYIFDKLFTSLHVSLADATKVPLRGESAIPAFETKSIDARLLGEPHTTELRERGLATIWMPVKDIVPGFQAGVIAFGPRLLDHDRALGVRFIRAYLRGVAAYNQGRTPENIDIINRWTHLDKKGLATTCWPAFRSDGSISTDSIVEFEQWARSKGMIDREVAPNQFWDGRFIAEARAQR